MRNKNDMSEVDIVSHTQKKEISDIINDRKAVVSVPKNVQLLRYHMYKGVEKTLRSISPKGIGLSISDWQPIIHSFMPDVSFYNLEYPEYDIQDLSSIPDNSVDVVYSEMILEHVENPQAAIDESYRILKKGGIVIHTTVFIMPYHPSPIDLTRFSPHLLEKMAKDFSDIHTGGSGNARSLFAMLCRMTRFPVAYPRGGIIPLLFKGNNPKYSICTWLIAEK